MEPILGIDLGTTNSTVSIIEDGKPKVLRDARGQGILPSVVGFDRNGGLLVGQEARNQALLAPERTVRSIKRKMGQDEKIQVGDRAFSPQEISAIILRTLKDRAEQELGRPATQAVITVPAFFNENQREATREAGQLAGLDVVRIINEPTAAALVYEPHSDRNERLLIYDLGGGTFDVSIIQIEQGVVEVLASHGDTHLGGDDFDQLLLDHVCDEFRRAHDIDLREFPTAKSRLLQAVEEAKKRLSNEALTTLSEEFIAEKDGTALHLHMEIHRQDYEILIKPLLEKTLKSVDAALEDAKILANQLDRVILVGGSTRTPMVQRLLQEQLHNEVHAEIDPDLCVSLGAAVQGGLIAGIDVGPVLVDITPHTLGIQCVREVFGMLSPYYFSPIITRNTPLPASRSEIYGTACEGQEAARIRVLQGENPDARFNTEVGEFLLEGLNEEADEGSEILVRFDLDLDGILTVSAVERETGLENRIAIDNAITQFRAQSSTEAKLKLAEIFKDLPENQADSEQAAALVPASKPDQDQDPFDAASVITKARELIPCASKEDAAEICELIDQFQQAINANNIDQIEQIREKLDDLVFYLEDV